MVESQRTSSSYACRGGEIPGVFFPLMARLGIVIAANLCSRYLLSLFAVRSVLDAESSPVNTPHVSCSSHVSIWEKEKDANKMEGETIACQIVIGARKKVGGEVGGQVGGGSERARFSHSFKLGSDWC